MWKIKVIDVNKSVRRPRRGYYLKFCLYIFTEVLFFPLSPIFNKFGTFSEIIVKKTKFLNAKIALAGDSIVHNSV